MKHGRNENGVWIGCYVHEEHLTEHHRAAYDLVKDETALDSTIALLINNNFTEVIKGGETNHFINEHNVLIEAYIWRYKELTINIKYTNFTNASGLQSFWNSFDALAAGEYDD